MAAASPDASLAASVVLVRGAPAGEGVVARLGTDRATALRELLARRAREWARASFPGVALREVDGGVADAVASVLSDGLSGPTPDDGAVVIVAPELAAWREGLGAAALDDLRAGCALSFGPVFDGGLYLLALSSAALGPLRESPELDLGGRGAMAELVTLAGHAGLEVGMLRTERGLRRADDLDALLADPLCDDELRGLLG